MKKLCIQVFKHFGIKEPSKQPLRLSQGSTINVPAPKNPKSKSYLEKRWLNSSFKETDQFAF